MKGKPEEKQKAYDLFCNTNLSQKDIAAVVGVSVQHMNKWVKTGNWDIYRTAGKVTIEKIIYGYYQQLEQLNEEILTSPTKSPTKAQSSTIAEITNSIKKLSRQYDLSSYHGTLTEFTGWLMTVDLESAKTLGPLMLEFLKYKAQKLNDDKARR